MSSLVNLFKTIFPGNGSKAGASAGAKKSAKTPDSSPSGAHAGDHADAIHEGFDTLENSEGYEQMDEQQRSQARERIAMNEAAPRQEKRGDPEELKAQGAHDEDVQALQRLQERRNRRTAVSGAKKTGSDTSDDNIAEKDRAGIPAQEPARAKALMMARTSFYRDGMRSALALVLLTGLMLLLSIVLNIYQFARSQNVVREYFSVSQDGRLTPIVPMDAPFLSDAQLLAWASNAVSQAFTMDAGNYRMRSNEIKAFFTDYGFQQYVRALEDSGQIDAMVQNNLILTATPLATPVISGKGMSGTGALMWRIQMPLLITYRTMGKGASIKQHVTLTVMRRPLSESPFGVGISQFITSPLSSSELVQ